MAPPRHFVRKPVGVGEGSDSWVLRVSGLLRASRTESARIVFGLVTPVLGAGGKEDEEEELPTVSEIRVAENGQTVFIVVLERRSGELIRDKLHGFYIGRGHRLAVEFSDRTTLEQQLQNDFNSLVFRTQRISQQESGSGFDTKKSSESLTASDDRSTEKVPLTEAGVMVPSVSAAAPTLPPPATDAATDMEAKTFLDSLKSSLPTYVPFKADAENRIAVEYPRDIRTLRLVNMVVENVVQYGPAFELALMDQQQNNPDYEFLFNFDLPLHIYYRWKLVSLGKSLGLSKNDTPGLSRSSVSLNDWQTSTRQGVRFPVPMELYPNMNFVPPFPPETLDREIDELQDRSSSPSLGPPPFTSLTSTTDRDRRVRTRPFLGEIPALHLTVLLRYVSYERGSIARVMAFAIDHEAAAPEIVDLICTSIEHPSATTQSRIARTEEGSDDVNDGAAESGGLYDCTSKAAAAAAAAAAAVVLAVVAGLAAVGVTDPDNGAITGGGPLLITDVGEEADDDFRRLELLWLLLFSLSSSSSCVKLDELIGLVFFDTGEPELYF
ncbi:hypothetical protein AWJ20_409 [Sugiyamaella lignohabitans]|uniref:SURP motif domain-containing protein n=1 Tax=Sugiyamaella lignohabitans TaxID=796027 RepID=A0A167CVZ9_9ASCO|nr:uncharacterized protein AWJ20_409 [Sugiyamaella lignohabitans]ANB12171.1 hypothetical protein AWJ20_409 [Sugiyamaella lignohabitans]